MPALAAASGAVEVKSAACEEVVLVVEGGEVGEDVEVSRVVGSLLV